MLSKDHKGFLQFCNMQNSEVILIEYYLIAALINEITK